MDTSKKGQPSEKRWGGARKKRDWKRKTPKGNARENDLICEKRVAVKNGGKKTGKK